MHEHDAGFASRRAKTSRCAKAARCVIGDGEIAIFNLGDRFVAVDNRCPHQGGPLCDGIVAGDSVVCPLHAWKVNLDTGARRASSRTSATASTTYPDARRRRASCSSSCRLRSRREGGMMTRDGFLQSRPHADAGRGAFCISTSASWSGCCSDRWRRSCARSSGSPPRSKGLLTAIPLLGGSFFRPDPRLARRIASAAAAPGSSAWRSRWSRSPSAGSWPPRSAQFYALGLLLGVAGASFAVALPLASRWYPPQYQGLAMGIAGAGNSGTLLATLFAPRLARALRLGTTLRPRDAAGRARSAIVFALLAKDSPGAACRRRRGATTPAVLSEPDTLLVLLPLQPDVRRLRRLRQLPDRRSSTSSISCHASAGRRLHDLVVVAGSLLRPVGGMAVGPFGGYRLLLVLLAGVARLPRRCRHAAAAAVVVVVLFCAMGMLGMGNGAVFQLVPQRFAGRIGIMTGIVGAAGGLGGFCCRRSSASPRTRPAPTAPGCW